MSGCIAIIGCLASIGTEVPALPAVGAAQRLDGLLDERAIGGAAPLAVGVRQLGALGHRDAPLT
jgi:hypothetical protein